MAAAARSTLVLLALKDDRGGLRFLVHPDFRNLVLTADLAYVEDLLDDFLGRAKKEREALFKQISSLGVGPVVTQEVGSDLAEYPAIESLCSRFVQLEM
jgi:hypothetical protein